MKTLFRQKIGSLVATKILQRATIKLWKSYQNRKMVATRNMFKATKKI